MIHYTSHQGRLHHFLCYGYEEQRLDDDEYRVITNWDKALEGAAMIGVRRFKPGVCLVDAVWHFPKQSVRHQFYCPDTLLPTGTEIEHEESHNHHRHSGCR